MYKQYIAYAVAALVVAAFLSIRTDRKVLSFLLTYWILAQPILLVVFTLHLPGFDLAANRMLLLVLLGYSFFSIMLGRKNTRNSLVSSPRPPFEKYLYLYFLVVCVSLVFNYSEIRPQDIVAIAIQIVTFIVVYLVAKNFVTPQVVESIIKAIVILTLTGAIIAFVQFAIDDTFLRTGDIRRAFGAVNRATGIFAEEYDFGAVQVLGFIVAIIRFRRSMLFYVLVPILALSVTLTFHRMDIITLVVCSIAYFWFYVNSARKVTVTIMMVIALIIGSAAYPLVGALIGESTIVSTLEGRIGQDTVTGRIEQYKVVATSIFTDPTLLGMGTYDNKAYDALMVKHGMTDTDASRRSGSRERGYAVHNGYLEVGILRGVIAMFLYIALLFSMFRHFNKKIYRGSHNAAIPVFAVFILMIINVSNGLSSFNIYSALLCAMLSGAFVAYRSRIESEIMFAQGGAAKESQHAVANVVRPRVARSSVSH